MASSNRGRPHASSREVLADAAFELFLERGYESTSVAEVTRRAGVSRSSFFNYFDSKSSILWFAFDEHVTRLESDLRTAGLNLREVLAGFGEGPSPETLALAIVDARTMGAENELIMGRAVRQLRIADAISARLLREGSGIIRAEIIAAGCAAALVGAVWRWAEQGAGRHPLSGAVGASLEVVSELFE